MEIRTAASLIKNTLQLGHKRYMNRLASLSPVTPGVWKTEESDPRNHTTQHEALFYEMPDEKAMLPIFGFASPFNIETTRFNKVIGKTYLMVRKPALTAIDYINRIEDGQPNVRMLFYGDKGQGKTHTLTHLLHYLYLKQTHFIFQIRQMKKYTWSPRNPEPSGSRKGRVDTPVDAAILLQQLRIQNDSYLERHKDSLVSSQDYQWSQREFTRAGEPIVNIIEHGVNRMNHASDCVAVLIKELMLAADQQKIRLASILDDVKFLFNYQTKAARHKDRKIMLIDEMTVARGLKKLIKNPYKNGLVLATCDDQSSLKQNQTPRQVLGDQGWNHFDPCLPIHVPKYTRREFDSCMDFYQDVNWLTRPEAKTHEVREELKFVSGLNPFELNYLCQSL